MPRITVISDEGVRDLDFSAGSSLRDLLNTSDLRIRSACRGNGACGLCRVRVLTGEVDPAGLSEATHLGAERLAGGERLACQIRPRGDMAVRLLAEAPPSTWRSPLDGDYQSDFPPDPCPDADRRIGVAIDLGTTHVCLALCDLKDGRRLTARIGPNPQAEHGSDIVSRLMAAADDPAVARQLQRLVVEAIGDGLRDMSSRDGLSLHDVARVAITGNTAMLTLLAGDDPRPLLDPARWTAPFSCRTEDVASWCTRWSLPADTPIEIIQPLAGFVGSDLAVGLVHARAASRDGPTLFIDFGTNCEMAVWDSERFHVTSAAGGPAFEGMGIGCGMAAEAGAIHRIRTDSRGEWSYEVIGAVPPTGICGSALVDALARLVATGALSSEGKFRETNDGGLSLPGTSFRIDKHDVDILQQAKAAISAGFEFLLSQAGIEPAALTAVLIGGAFGRTLDPASAIAIGLLPLLPSDRVHLLGNTSLNGCQDWLVSNEARQALADLRDRYSLINLSQQESFENLFFEHLFLRPFFGASSKEDDGSSGTPYAPNSQDFCFTAFVHATQYIAGLLPDADVNREAVAIATRVFKADCAGMYTVLEEKGATLVHCSHPDIFDALAKDLSVTLGQVMESGFMSVDEYSLHLGEVCFICLPITQSGKLTAILAVGFVGMERPARELLDALLGVVGLIGATVTHQAAKAIMARYAEDLEGRVRQRTVELEAANKELEAFAYSVSHDLRAPLRAIDGFSLKLVNRYGDRLDEEGRRIVQVVRHGAQRMGHLIDDLLAFSRMGRRDMVVQMVNMDAMARNVAEEVLATEPERDISCTFAPLPCAWGDAAMLRQVWVNLLGNAVKFSRRRQSAHIEIAGRMEGDEAVYWVKDDGAGFDMRYADKLFGVFQRLHRQEEFDGTGVGLAIVQRILLRHGGRIWGEGQPDVGATFWLALPRTPPDDRLSEGPPS